MAFALASDVAGVLSQLSRRDRPGETTESGSSRYGEAGKSLALLPMLTYIVIHGSYS
jgi:hypothetical protein